MHQDTPTQGPAIMIHSHLPGLGMSLILPGTDDPGLHEGPGTCRKECWVGPGVGMEKGCGGEAVLWVWRDTGRGPGTEVRIKGC